MSILIHQLNKIKNQLRLQVFKSKIKVNPLTHFLVFSDPRGGSTWLMEIVKQITNKPVLWEPLHVRKVKELNKIGFGWRQYIPENGEWKAAKLFFNKLFKGKVINNWIMQQTTKQELQDADQFIIKFCRGNALLPYLTNQFNFKYKPILMVRHPFAVVASQLKHGGWKNTSTHFEIPNLLYNNHYKDHDVFLNSLQTKVETLTATWCLTNQIPLGHPKNNKAWITITYEELLVYPEATIKRVLEQWQLPYDMSKINFKQQSSTTVAGSPETISERLQYWKKSFSQEEIDAMIRVLNYFEVKLYDRNPEPLYRFK